jgi:hypothetical protein
MHKFFIKFVPKKFNITFEFLQFKIHWNLKSDYENEMFYEKCKKSLNKQNNNFNHSFKKCFDNFKFFEHEKDNDKESEEKSILYVLSDGIYLLTMFALIMFLFPFFVYVYLNLFYEKKTVIDIIKTNIAENENEKSCQQILLISMKINEPLLELDCDNENVMKDVYAETEKSFEIVQLNSCVSSETKK